MASTFEQLFSELTPEQCLFYSDWHGVAAIPDKFPRLPYQSVVLAERGFGHDQRVVGDLRARNRLRLHAVADAVQRQLQSICEGDERAVMHVEGYNVPDDPHIIVLQSPARKSGANLYTGPVIDWPQERTLGQLSIKGTDYDYLCLELDRIDDVFPVLDSHQL
jgi:hypothetical protein